MSRFSPTYIAWCIRANLPRFGADIRAGDWFIEPPVVQESEVEVLGQGWLQLIERGMVRPFVFHSVNQLAGVGPGPWRVWLPTADDWIELLSALHSRQGSFRDEAARESIVVADILRAVAEFMAKRCETDPLMAAARVWEVWVKGSSSAQTTEKLAAWRRRSHEVFARLDAIADQLPPLQPGEAVGVPLEQRVRELRRRAELAEAVAAAAVPLAWCRSTVCNCGHRTFRHDHLAGCAECDCSLGLGAATESGHACGTCDGCRLRSAMERAGEALPPASVR